MKKLINKPGALVREMLEGFVATTPGVGLLDTCNVIIRLGLGPAQDRRVALISGGGSGHEPAHAGYVGEGMLTAAVAGEVFTSPDVDSILAAILASAGPAGALLIVKNYTGDRLNFGLAAELARERGIPTEVVIVGDDVSLRGRVAADRRRGIAGTVLVHKIAGAAAASGRPLAEVAGLARSVAGQLATMGVGYGSCLVPATGRSGFSLGEDEIEFGLGIHGEAGVRKARLTDVDDVIAVLVDEVLDELLKSGQPRASIMMLNGLGGTPPMELQIAARAGLSLLRQRGWNVQRVLVGNFMTALEMPGVSLTVLAVEPHWLDYFGADTKASAWPRLNGELPRELSLLAAPVERVAAGQMASSVGPLTATLKQVVKDVAATLLSARDQLTDLDARAGDGDLGVSMGRGAEALLRMNDAAYATPTSLLVASAQAMRRAIGGSSGPFYATALLRASRELGGDDHPALGRWADALQAAVTAVAELGGAKLGDRTMIDALHPASASLLQSASANLDAGHALDAAVMAAREGAAATALMRPGAGRASYIGDKVIGIEDGGAVAVAVWLAAIADSLKRNS